jgi:two-component sensor histidine kinase
MKRALVYMLFSVGMTHGFAQKQNSQPVVIAIPDSVLIARKQLSEGTSIGIKDTAQSLPLLRAAARIFKKENLALEEGKSHMAIGDIFFENGQYGRSFGNYLTAQDLFYEVSQRDLFYATLGVAKSQYHRGLYRFAAKSFSEVVEYSYKNNDEKLRAAATEYLGEIFFIFQSNTESKNYYTTAFNTLKDLNDDKGCLRIAGKLFTLQYQDKKFDSALWYSNVSIALAKKLNDRTTLRTSTLNKISAMIRLKQFEEAKRDLDIFSKIQLAEWEMTTRIRYESLNGNYYLALKENEKAKEVYDSALKHASITNTPDLLAVVYGNMADSYADQGDYEKAYAYSLKYQAMMNNFFSNSISYLSKIESLIKEDVFNGKIKYLSSINKIKELELLRDKDAKQNLETENKLKDSILQQEKLLSKALEVENGYKGSQLESQRQLSTTLNRESQLQKNQLKQERDIKVLLIVALISLLFLGLLALYHYRRTKAKNAIIQKQARDLEILVKEIHHRVKNNLQIISSLLDIQSMTVESEQALQAIRGSKNRVQSMAIIHRFLYHEDNIRGIALEDYLQNLCENLFTSYNINPDTITLQTNIDKLNLDVDTMIPLGLVINELISNSLKYAFSEKERGTLLISLKEKENCLHLEVRDNGKGFPNKNIKHKQTFGLQLISAFAQKMKAEWELYNDNGAVVCMRIRKYKLA